LKAGWVLSADRGPLALDLPGRAAAPTEARPAAFLDRDGVLNACVPDPDSGLFESPLKLADVRLLPGVAQPLRELVDAGYAIVCVSNQPLAAKGKSSLQELLALHERVLALLEAEGMRVEISRLCPHHPDGVVKELSGPCSCRKPKPGMLLDAARAQRLDLAASWMLGDTDNDVLAGQQAGCRTALIEYPQTAHKRTAPARPDLRAGDLAAAVGQLLERGSR
jgi:D-glycero-D-manno-heptose 1,7-bisphosphate phosphatase